MKVADLVSELLTLPQDADVLSIWDGEPRTDINAVWLSRSGRVMLCDVDDVVYSEESRPPWSPSQKENPHWAFSDGAGQNNPQQSKGQNTGSSVGS